MNFMKGTLGLLFIISFALVIGHCNEINKEDSGDEQLNLDNDFLELSSWGTNDSKFGWFIDFEKDGVYYEEFEGEGCGGYRGKYNIEKNRVVLRADKGVECVPDKINVKKRICKIYPDNESLIGNYILDCKKGNKYWSKTYLRPKGEKVTINKSSYITMGFQAVLTTKELSIHQKPKNKSNTIRCYFKIDNPDPNIKNMRTTIPKKTRIYLLARTIKKKKSKGKKAFWYYINLEFSWHDYCSQKQGWIHGYDLDDIKS